MFMNKSNYFQMATSRIITMILLCVGALPVVAQNTKTYTFKFDEKDFEIVRDTTGFGKISSKRHSIFLISDPHQPALPYFSTQILIPANSEVDNVLINGTPQKIASNLKIKSNPIQIISKKGEVIDTQASFSYDTKKVYPQKQISSYNSGSMDGYKLVSISYTPFQYDANKQELSLITQIELSIITSPTYNKDDNVYGLAMQNAIEHCVINPEDVKKYYPMLNLAKSFESDGIRIDYLIITRDSLKEAFYDLLMFKALKGLNVAIKSIEEIESEYGSYNDDIQEKIKCCIAHYKYDGFHTKYVLLGGDENIIPPRLCYGHDSNTFESDDIYYNIPLERTNIPTDLYYACLDPNFTWDYNRNGIYGEPTDNIDIYPDIYVSRLPINTSQQVKDYTNKLVTYERGEVPLQNYFQKILFGGMELFSNISSVSDSYYWGQYIYNDQISPLPKNDLFDTQSTWYNRCFSTEDLQETLSNGYNLINISTHGEYDKWNTMQGSNYTTLDADSLQSPCTAFIITNACHVNNFAENHSLGESFILNPHNGNIAFWGSSSFGFGVDCSSNNNNQLPGGDEIGASDRYIDSLYKYIFKKGKTILSEASTLSKIGLIGMSNSNEEIRWLMFSHNLLGDVESSITLNELNTIGDVNMHFSIDNIKVYSNKYDCYYTLGNTVTVDPLDEPEYMFYHYSDPVDTIACFDGGPYEGMFEIGVIKEGYIPFNSNYDTFNNIYLQNHDAIDSQIWKCNHLLIGSNVNSEEEDGPVKIACGQKVNISISQDAIISDNFECPIGAELEINIINN